MSSSAYFWLAAAIGYTLWVVVLCAKTWYTDRVHDYYELGMKMGRAQATLGDDVIAAMLADVLRED